MLRPAAAATSPFPDVAHAGFVGDAAKEVAEATHMSRVGIGARNSCRSPSPW